MSVQKILLSGNPALRQISKPVGGLDKKVQKLVADLEQTLKVQKDPVGVGLAAPQVGKSIRLFLVKIGTKPVAFINPEITWLSKTTNDPKPKVRNRKSEVGQPKSEVRNKMENGKWKMENEEEREYLMEGCLSLPHYYGPVQRAAEVKVTYDTLERMANGVWQMVKKQKKYRGLSAQIVQHEIDHLNGVLFIDRLLQQNRKLYEQRGKEWIEVELP